MSDPQVEYRHSMAVIGTDAEPFKVANPPYKLSESHAEARNVLPHLGQHTEEVLRTVLGYDDERLSEIQADGAFRSPVTPAT